MTAIRIVLAGNCSPKGTDLGRASMRRLDAALAEANIKNDWFVFGAASPPGAAEGCPTLACLQTQYVRIQDGNVYAPLTPRLGWGTYDELRAALQTAFELSIQLGQDVEEVVIHTSRDHMSRTRMYARFLLEKVEDIAPIAEHGVIRFSSSGQDLLFSARCREVVAIVAFKLGITTTPRWARVLKELFQSLGEYEIHRMRTGTMPTVPRD